MKHEERIAKSKELIAQMKECCADCGIRIYALSQLIGKKQPRKEVCLKCAKNSGR